ncbi:hypothetical protein RhiirB3_449347 [Rhizophagus irregularis]|nr:hypothetical protein RhiirB3_449347 [Rhizophagus irregularis]
MDNMLIRDNNDSFEALAYMLTVVSYICLANNETTFNFTLFYLIYFTEATWLIHEQLKTLKLMKNFFENDALREYAIVVLSRPNSSQMDNPEKMKFYLNEIKRLIALIPGVYASEKATEIWQQYIANVCQVQEDKKAAKKEYEENLQNEGKATANKK